MSISRRLCLTVSFAFIVAIAASGLAVLSSSSVEGGARPSGSGNPDSSSLAVAPASIEDLGRLLFYDGRLSGDGSTSCTTCHGPNDAFADGKPLSDGYSRGNLYFRNTPTLLNASKMPVYDWDGRFAQGDLATVVRDHIAEAHFMNLDGRLLVERMRQVPEYEDGFKQQLGSEVSYGKVLNAVVAYIRTLESSADNQYVAHTAGDQNALSAQQGLCAQTTGPHRHGDCRRRCIPRKPHRRYDRHSSA